MLTLKALKNSQKDHREPPGRGARGILGEDGASIVELALSCAVIFMMLFGIVYMSFALYTYHYISNAAREGSRYAMVRGSTSCANSSGNLTGCGADGATIQTYVQNLGYPGIDAANKMTVTTTWYTVSTTKPATWSLCAGGGIACRAPGNIVKVVVTYAFPLNIPFYPSGTLNMTSTSQMVISQ